jgi:transposase
VSNYIELAAGKAAGGRSRSLAPAKRAEIVAALEANPNARQVARQISGVSTRTVYRIAKAEGFPLTRRRPNADQDVVVARRSGSAPKGA